MELFIKYDDGESLENEELDDLANFKKDRKKERGYGRELLGLIDANARGEEIDTDRLHSLELFARHHTGESVNDLSLPACVTILLSHHLINVDFNLFCIACTVKERSSTTTISNA